MAESKVVSVRVPEELLDALDHMAAIRYPSRRGGEPNRSQIILDLLEEGVYGVDDSVNSSNTDLAKLEHLVEKKLRPLKKQLSELKAVLALGESLGESQNS